MNILSWNVGGVAGTDFKRVFRDMITSYKPDIVILTKTRVSGDRANSIIKNLVFDRFIKVDAMGFSGGIWVLWNPQNVTVEPITTAFLELFLKVQFNTHIFILTALYASPIFSVKKSL